MSAPLHVRTKLRELRRLSAMGDSASFSMAHEKLKDVGSLRDYDPDMTVDAFVKERTRVYRETWILPLLDELLEWAGEPTIAWESADDRVQIWRAGPADFRIKYKRPWSPIRWWKYKGVEVFSTFAVAMRIVQIEAKEGKSL